MSLSLDENLQMVIYSFVIIPYIFIESFPETASKNKPKNEADNRAWKESKKFHYPFHRL